MFLSPLPQSILCYDTVWSRLSGMANLVALDLPGFGRSEGGYEHMSFEAQSAFLEAFIDAQELEDVMWLPLMSRCLLPYIMSSTESIRSKA